MKVLPYMKPSNILKLIVSIALFLYLFSSIDLAEFVDVFEHINTYYLTLYFILGVVTTVVSCIKWKVLCDAIGIQVALRSLVSFYFLGYFYNNFLPTGVGGDVIRALELSKTGASKADSFATVFVERYTGLLALVSLVSIVIFLDARIYSNTFLLLFYCFILVAFTLGSILVFNRKFLSFCEKFCSIGVAQKIVSKARSFQDSLFLYKGASSAIFYAMIWSYCFYGLAVVATHVGLQAFGAEVSALHVFIAVPVMLMVFLLPISLGGLGLQEWSHAFVFTLMGVPPVVGVGLGVIFRFRQFVFSGFGALVSVFLARK